MNRTNLRFVLLALLFAALTWVCGAGVVMNAAFSTGIGDGHYRAAVIFEVLTLLCLVVTVVFVVITWRFRHRRDASGR